MAGSVLAAGTGGREGAELCSSPPREPKPDRDGWSGSDRRENSGSSYRFLLFFLLFGETKTLVVIEKRAA